MAGGGVASAACCSHGTGQAHSRLADLGSGRTFGGPTARRYRTWLTAYGLIPTLLSSLQSAWRGMGRWEGHSTPVPYVNKSHY